MSNATLPILTDRYGACVRQIYIAGLDLTGVAMRAQVRLGGDVPGAPLVDLVTVGNGNAEGLRLVDVTTTAGVPTSHVELVINETTMEALPYAGEVGSATALAWDWQVTIAGRKRRIAGGAFVIRGDGVTGADAAPANRPAAYGGALPGAGGMTSGARLQFGDEITTIVIDGAALLGAMVETAEVARDKARDWAQGAGRPGDVASRSAKGWADQALENVRTLPNFYVGNPGGNIEAVPSFAAIRARGLTANPMVIPSGTTSVRTSYHTTPNFGGDTYIQRADLTDAHLATFARSTFKAVDENGTVTRWMVRAQDGFAYESFGCVPFTGAPGAANDCSPALTEMHAVNAFLVGFSKGEVPGRRIILGRGRYAHYGTASLHAKWEFFGQGGGTAGGPGNSTLVFVGNIHGIVVNRHNTDIDQVGAENSQGAADGTAFRQLDIESYGKTDQTKHLLWARARYVIDGVKLVNRAGNAIHSVGNSSADATLGTNVTAGNVNDFQIARTVIDNAGGQHAFYNAGIDSNSGNTEGLSVLASGCGGIIDLNFLQNTHKAWAVHGCGDRRLGSVSYAGSRYRLISAAPGIGASTAPGTNDLVWYRIGAGAASAEFPAWSNSGTYIVSGGILCDNPNSRTTFHGGYTEFGAIGICHVVSPSMVYGGSLDTDFTRYSSFEFIPFGVGRFRSHNGGYGSYRPTVTYAQGVKDAYGDYMFAAFAEEMLENAGAFEHVGRHNAALSEFRRKYDGRGIRHDWANGTRQIYQIGYGYAETHGRSTTFGSADALPVIFDHGIILSADGRRITQSSGPPAGGVDRAAGDIAFNMGVGDPCLGYKVVTPATVANGAVTKDAVFHKAGATFIDAVIAYDPPSLAPGATSPISTAQIAGCEAGDVVSIGYLGDSKAVDLRGWVFPNGTLNYFAHNPPGNPNGVVDLAPANLKIRVEKMS